jgi:hypothetical protein
MKCDGSPGFVRTYTDRETYLWRCTGRGSASCQHCTCGFAVAVHQQRSAMSGSHVQLVLVLFTSTAMHGVLFTSKAMHGVLFTSKAMHGVLLTSKPKTLMRDVHCTPVVGRIELESSGDSKVKLHPELPSTLRVPHVHARRRLAAKRRLQRGGCEVLSCCRCVEPCTPHPVSRQLHARIRHVGRVARRATSRSHRLLGWCCGHAGSNTQLCIGRCLHRAQKLYRFFARSFWS